jgi:hypothetical protein
MTTNARAALIAAPPKPAVVVASAGILAVNQIRAHYLATIITKSNAKKSIVISAHFPPLQQYVVQCLSVIDDYAMPVCVWCVCGACNTVQARMSETISRKACALMHDFSALMTLPPLPIAGPVCIIYMRWSGQLGIASRQ